MKILGKQPSREKCAESGWFATDYLLDAPIDRAFILSLRPLGSFVYLDMLKEPFFKIENDYYMIKGVQGKDTQERIYSCWFFPLSEIFSCSCWYSSSLTRNDSCFGLVLFIPLPLHIHDIK